MFQYSIGVTALSLSQFGVSAVSNNIANANTPGFHRRQVLLASLPEYQNAARLVGGGVGLGAYRQMRNQLLENDLSHAVGDLAGVQEQLRIDNRMESMLGSGPGSLQQLLSGFESSLRQLSTLPSDATQRRLVLDNASRLTSQVRETAGGLRALKSEVRRSIETEVDSLNEKLTELADLQSRLYVMRDRSTGAELVDRRDQLINEIAEIIDVNRNELSNDGFGLALGGGTLSVGQVPMTVTARIGEDGQLALSVDDFGIPLKPRGGKLAALLEAHNSSIDGFQTRLATMTTGLIRSVDQAHAQGIGPRGSFGSLVSQRRLESTSLPISQSSPQLPVSAGELYLTVTDPAGVRRTNRISYDPATQSLQDLATSISGITGLTAAVSPVNGTLSIRGNSGFQFDFTGRLDSVPDLSGYTGTARPAWSGEFSGTSNDRLRVELVGSGQVGVTDGLKARVFDQSGEMLKEIDLGSSYAPGTAVEIGSGIKLAFGDGTIVAGEQFQSELVANSDTGGILSALGLNSFFSGSSPEDIELSRQLRDDPQLLASGRTADAADGANLARLLAALETPVEGDLDAAASLIGMGVEAGSRVQTASALESQLSALKTRVEGERDNFSGVDLNEEMVNLTRYQKAFDAALKVLQSIDGMYEETLRILG